MYLIEIHARVVSDHPFVVDISNNVARANSTFVGRSAWGGSHDGKTALVDRALFLLNDGDRCADDWVAFGVAWSELQTAANNYRLLPADRRDSEAQRQLVDKVNEVMAEDTGRWAARRRSLAERR